jgi:hypothetical protein
MNNKDDWTPGDVAAMIANPFYAINFDEGLIAPHEPMLSEEDWVKANVNLIGELGPEAYLRNLLSVLKGNYPRSSS